MPGRGKDVYSSICTAPVRVFVGWRSCRCRLGVLNSAKACFLFWQIERQLVSASWIVCIAFTSEIGRRSMPGRWFERFKQGLQVWMLVELLVRNVIVCWGAATRPRSSNCCYLAIIKMYMILLRWVRKKRRRRESGDLGMEPPELSPIQLSNQHRWPDLSRAFENQ